MPSSSALHELSEANGPVELTDLVAAVLDADGPAPADTYICPDCGQPHDASDLDPGELAALAGFDLDFDLDRMDLAHHAVTTVSDLIDFEAVVTGPGRSAGGTVTLTPLGRHLAEAVFGSISPPAADTAEDLVTAVASVLGRHPYSFRSVSACPRSASLKSEANSSRRLSATT